MSYGDGAGSLQQFSELWVSSRYPQRTSNSIGQERGKSSNSNEPRDGTVPNDLEDRNVLLDDPGSIGRATPSWLSTALLRQQGRQCAGEEADSSDWCTSGSLASNIQSSSVPLGNHSYNDWMARIPRNAHACVSRAADLVEEVYGGTGPAVDGHSVDRFGQLNYVPNAPAAESSRRRGNENLVLGLHVESATGAASVSENMTNDQDDSDHDKSQAERMKYWQEARLKARVLSHPLFPQMLAAHVGCLRIATPVEHLSEIDEQLAQSQSVIDKYSGFSAQELQGDAESNKELDDFMRNYTMLLMTFQDQLQHHVEVHATQAMADCYKIEQRLKALTGVTASAGSGTGPTMSEDEDDEAGESEIDFENENANNYDFQDSGGYGPLVPTETERTLMERVKKELKATLQDGYRAKIVDVREEILRKRRAGKLPEGTTTVLKAWWDAHAKWPYPTEDEKEHLIQETGLELKQVNNWFINQRKRNWQAHPLSDLKNKRKGGM